MTTQEAFNEVRDRLDDSCATLSKEDYATVLSDLIDDFKARLEIVETEMEDEMEDDIED